MGRLKRVGIGLCCGALVAAMACVSPVDDRSAQAATTVTVAGPASAAPDPSCPNVMVLGARGSGERTSDPDPANGMGRAVTTFYEALAARLKGKVTVDSRHVRYTAADVNVLWPTQAEIDRVMNALPPARKFVVADILLTYKSGHVDLFTASIDEGVATAFDELSLQATRCPSARFVLAGYSQGAMVMHQLLLRLSDQGDTTLLDRIADTVLIADGDRKKETAAVTFGTAGRGAEGVRSVFTVGERDIPPRKAASTYDICDKGDIVCDFTPQALTRLDRSTRTHESYPDSSVVKNVGRIVGAHLLAHAFVTTTSLPVGQVGVPYTGSLAGTGVAPLTWSAVTALPPGLSLSPRGSVTGTPTSSGDAYVDVRVTDAVGSTSVATVYLTINAGAAPPPTAGTWTPTGLGLTDPADHGSANGGVSCATAANCTAVGFDCCTTWTAYGAVARPLVQTLAGGVWTVANPPLPSDAGPYYTASLSGVACASATTCVAAGRYWDRSTRDSLLRPLLETLNAGTWTPTSPPLPANAFRGFAELSGVSCASTTVCIAVGYYPDNVSAYARPLAETLVDGVWTPTTLPLPDEAFEARLDSASCVSATACTAYGSYMAADGSLLPLVETLVGSVWTPTSLPLPDGEQTFYQSGGVSCASATTCTATGTYIDANGVTLPFAASLAAGVWTSTKLPLPVDSALGGQSLAVSCASATTCTAVGSAGDLPLVQTLAGGVWTATSAPLPAEATGGTLYGVSCVSTTDCTASGEHHSSAYPYGRPLAETKAP